MGVLFQVSIVGVLIISGAYSGRVGVGGRVPGDDRLLRSDGRAGGHTDTGHGHLHGWTVWVSLVSPTPSPSLYRDQSCPRFSVCLSVCQSLTLRDSL